MMEYELFFNYSMDMYVIAGADGYFKRANPAFCNILGRTEEELLSKPFAEIIHPDDLINVNGALKNLDAGHPVFLVEVRLLAGDGTYRRLLWTAYPDRRTGLLFAIARDNSLPFFDPQRIKLLLDSSPTAVFLVERTGTITYSNHLAEMIFGYGKNELIGKPIETLVLSAFHDIHKQHRDRYIAAPLLRPMGTRHNLIGSRKKGETFPIDIGLNPVWLEHGMTIICSVIDTSSKVDHFYNWVAEKRELVKANSHLGHLADHDALTGLYNRRAFERILMQELTAARESNYPISVIMADIDHFKFFNDSFGHPVGDIVLRNLGSVLKHNIRTADTVARFGGEEFILCLPGIDREAVMTFGERLRRLIEKGHWRSRSVTVSLGATTYQFKSKRISLTRIMKQLLSEADQAMYASKRLGRNRLQHYEDTREK
jgi:diguanylate cyclase (GGDEF)-like protein/PAS domain S-box-containing protein